MADIFRDVVVSHSELKDAKHLLSELRVYVNEHKRVSSANLGYSITRLATAERVLESLGLKDTIENLKLSGTDKPTLETRLKALYEVHPELKEGMFDQMTEPDNRLWFLDQDSDICGSYYANTEIEVTESFESWLPQTIECIRIDQPENKMADTEIEQVLLKDYNGKAGCIASYDGTYQIVNVDGFELYVIRID